MVVFLRKDDLTSTILARKKLKGSGITIVEDLSKETHQLFNRVRKDPRVDSAWTWEGKVKIKVKDGKVYHIRYGQQLDELFSAT